MLPLVGSEFPATLEHFTSALRDGLTVRGFTPRDVRAHGDWPQIDKLTVDLTNASTTRHTQPARAARDRQSGPTIKHLTITGAPVFFETLPLRFDLRVLDAECGLARDTAAGLVLEPIGAASGSLLIEAQRADLTAALKNLATAALAKQGAEIKSATLEFTARSPRSLDFRAEVSAKVFVMTARIAVAGKLDVDDRLNLRLRDLSVSGDGMIASIATSYLRPKFAEIEKTIIPLDAFSFAGVKVRDVRLSGGDSLRLEAEFGS